MSEQRSTVRRRWLGALPVGLGGLACVACCTVPLWIAGGFALGGTSLALDRCLDSLLPALAVLVLATFAAMVLASRTRRRRVSENSVGDCPCPPPAVDDTPSESARDRARL